ncbi:type III pantothenate kinase [Curtanaerobium respiraculi]|uniref:type III pantothenate kinase n=1 Tax=Curtanaerobium respiraculi TaxID=2949669 RepID=UPI0024B3985E|nr:type III pantothenate kinase [Curtanaerobium respiraculi]
MLLTVDVGNSHTVLGVHDGSRLRHMWRVETNPKQTVDEVRVALHGLLGVEGMGFSDITDLCVGTVVPLLKSLWCRVGASLCGENVLAVGPDSVRGLLDVSSYASTPGADRLADAVAARALYGDPVIVIDMGTATNIEAVGEGGRFLGGAIAPGVQTSIDGLVSHTALLPEVELVDPGRAIGASTVSAIQIGVVYGQVDGLDGMVRRMWDELGGECPVIATGGFGAMLDQLSQTVTVVNPELTLEGLRLIYEANRR